jgi:hypothetical protein
MAHLSAGVSTVTARPSHRKHACLATLSLPWSPLQCVVPALVPTAMVIVCPTSLHVSSTPRPTSFSPSPYQACLTSLPILPFHSTAPLELPPSCPIFLSSSVLHPRAKSPRRGTPPKRHARLPSSAMSASSLTSASSHGQVPLQLP